jgi:hypothetical protein
MGDRRGGVRARRDQVMRTSAAADFYQTFYQNRFDGADLLDAKEAQDAQDRRSGRRSEVGHQFGVGV